MKDFATYFENHLSNIYLARKQKGRTRGNVMQEKDMMQEASDCYLQTRLKIRTTKRYYREQIKQLKKEKKQKVRLMKLGIFEDLPIQADDCALKPHFLFPKRYTTGEEIFNSTTHGIAAGLSIAALCLLVVKAAKHSPCDTALFVTSWSIFGSTLVILYTMSTLYHALTPYLAKQVFSIFDHSCIYLLIAGTYTPFCLSILGGAWGWAIFGIIWGLAILGITFYAIFGNKLRLLSVATYILMGYLVVIAAKPMQRMMSKTTLVLLLSGGLSYTFGCIFYALKKIKWMHCIWHLFVMLGSTLHFFAVYLSIPS